MSFQNTLSLFYYSLQRLYVMCSMINTYILKILYKYIPLHELVMGCHWECLRFSVFVLLHVPNSVVLFLRYGRSNLGCFKWVYVLNVYLKQSFTSVCLRMVLVGRNLKDHLNSNPLPWAGMTPTRPGYPRQRMGPGMGHPQCLRETDSSASPPSE